MKKVLLGLLFGASQLTLAQMSCAAATPITANGQYTAPAITGTYFASCDQTNGETTNSNGIWYSYTPSSNGTLTITSNLATNVAPLSDDTRVSIFSGTCAALVCVGGNDDISGTNYLSTLTVNVAAGTTYYIEWDDRWSDAGFDWTLTFTAVACSPITPTTVQTTATANSFTGTWSPAVGSPAAYDVEYGPLGFTQGTGTMVTPSPTSPSVTVGSLTPGGDYSYYVRSRCDLLNQSTWAGPFNVALIKPLPYSTNFDTNAELNGLSTNGWSLSATAGAAQSGTQYLFVNNSTTAATNAQVYTRQLQIANNELVTLTFYTRLGNPAGTPHNLKVYRNSTNSLTGATQIGSTIVVNTGTYAMQTVTFSVPTTGTYYIGFSSETPIATTATSLRFDTVAFTSVLATNEVSEAGNSLSIYPNPTSDILNIKTDSKIKSVSVFDMSGRKVKTSFENNVLNVKDLQTGTYVINVETAEGKFSERFIKK